MNLFKKYLRAGILLISVANSAHSIDLADAAALGIPILLGAGVVVQGECAIRNLRQQRRELIRSHLGLNNDSETEFEQQLAQLANQESRARRTRGFMLGAALTATAFIALLKVRAKETKKIRGKLKRNGSVSDLFSNEESHKETLCGIEDYLELSHEQRFLLIREKYKVVLASVGCHKNFKEKKLKKDQKKRIKRLGQSLSLFFKLDKDDIEEYLPVLKMHYEETIQPERLKLLYGYFMDLKEISNAQDMSVEQISAEIKSLRVEFLEKFDDGDLFLSIMNKATKGSRFIKSVTGGM